MTEIVETMTETMADQKAQEAHLARAVLYAEQTKTQPDGSKWIYPRNAATGEIMWDAQPTIEWAEPVATPDNTFEFPQPPDVEPAYTGKLETDYVVRERPAEWDDNMEDMQFNAQFNTPQFE